MANLFLEIRLILRSLARRPLSPAMVILTLGLGIGANTAIFSVVNGILLRPLPYGEPEELALIWSRWNNFDKTWVSEAEYLDYLAMNQVFADVASWSGPGNAILTGDGRPESVQAMAATANLASVLGVRPAMGRMFTPEEDTPGGPNVVVLGHDLWQRRYGGDSSVVGRAVLIDGESYAVVGILPQQFRFPLEFQERTTAQLIVPIRFNPSDPARGSHGSYAVARLNSGITIDAVNDLLRSETTRWTEEGLYSESMRFTAFAVSMAGEVQGGVRPAVLVLFGAVGLLLLLTCANVANLLLTQADGRSRETAVRAALGAGKGVLIRLTMIESIALGLGGGIVGVVLAWIGVDAVAASAPAGIPRVNELAVNGPVLVFALILSVGTGLLFGLLPALRLNALNLATQLRDGRRGGETKAQHRGRELLVVGEVALAVVLVTGAGLTIRSFAKLNQLDPGFVPERVLTMGFSLPEATYPSADQVVRFYETLVDRVRGIPGVETAGLVRALPLATEIGDAGMAIEDRPVAPDEPNRQADWQVVSDGYFETMGMRLARGRFFDETDTPEGQQVIAINETLANQYFPGEDPVGKRIRVLRRDEGPWRVVVGVIGDVRHNGLTNPTKRKWFVPHNQWANSSPSGQPRRALTLVLRAGGNPLAVFPAVEGIVREMDPDLPVTNMRTMDDVMRVATQEQRFTTGLMSSFALLALLLAGVGIYGVVSYSIGRRTQEIGVRLALGGNQGRVLRYVFRQGIFPATVGIIVGSLAAMIFSRSMSTLLYQVSPLDWPTFVTIPVLLLGVASAAVLIPVRRALRVDPMQALRYE